MSEEPTNRELAIKIDNLREIIELKFEENEKDHKAVNAHLKQLNGQVIKNTKFRWQTYVYGSIALIVIPVIVTKLVNELF